jgi:hypothetical protein
MGTNTSDGYRIGSVQKRSQVYNEKTGKFIKRDTETGKFMSSKDTPYKGVKTEKKSSGETKTVTKTVTKTKKTDNVTTDNKINDKTVTKTKKTVKKIVKKTVKKTDK